MAITPTKGLTDGNRAVWEAYLAENAQTGYLRVQTSTASGTLPAGGANVTIEKAIGGDTFTLAETVTDRSGQMPPVALPAPDRMLSRKPGGVRPYATYSVRVRHPRFQPFDAPETPVFDGVTSIQPARLVPLFGPPSFSEPGLVPDTEPFGSGGAASGGGGTAAGNGGVPFRGGSVPTGNGGTASGRGSVPPTGAPFDRVAFERDVPPRGIQPPPAPPVPPPAPPVSPDARQQPHGQTYAAVARLALDESRGEIAGSGLLPGTASPDAGTVDAVPQGTGSANAASPGTGSANAASPDAVLPGAASPNAASPGPVPPTAAAAGTGVAVQPPLSPNLPNPVTVLPGSPVPGTPSVGTPLPGAPTPGAQSGFIPAQ